MDESKIGVITEQGDLGLGFTPVTEEEQKKIDEIFNKKKEEVENKNK